MMWERTHLTLVRKKHWRDGWRTRWTFVSFEYPLVHEERFWREWPTQWHRCVIDRTES